MKTETHGNQKVTTTQKESTILLGTTRSSKEFTMSKQITGLAKYIIKMAHNRHYNGRDKVMVKTMLEMADLLNQFAEAKDKQKQLDWRTEAMNMLLEKSYKKADSQTKNDMEVMYWKSKGRRTHFTKKLYVKL